MKALVMILSGCLMVAGCSGNPEYSCGQFPESGCQPVSDVYDRTNSGFHDYRKNMFKPDPAQGESSIAQSGHIEIAQAHRSLNWASPGDPVLTKPETMRVFVSPWVDKDRDLNAGGFIYIRLRDGQWQIK